MEILEPLVLVGQRYENIIDNFQRLNKKIQPGISCPLSLTLTEASVVQGERGLPGVHGSPGDRGPPGVGVPGRAVSEMPSSF